MGDHNKVHVFWDLESCAVPRDVDPQTIAKTIRQAIAGLHLQGPTSFSAYGDIRTQSSELQEALASTNITVNHIPNGQKEAFDKALIVGIFVWALETTPPAHIFLICGDRDFSNGLHALRNKCYNILLACPSGVKVPHTCTGAASSVWDWASLAQGSGLKPHDPDAPNPSLKSENATWRSTIPAWKTAGPTSPPPNPTALPAKSAENAWRNSPTAWKVVSQPMASPQPAVTEQHPVGLPAVKLLKTNPLDGKLYLNSKGKKLIDSAMASLESDKLSPVRNAVTARMKEILEGLGESSSYHSLKQVAEVAVASEYLTFLEGSLEGEIVVPTSRLSGGCWEIIYPHDTTDAYGTDTWHALRTFLETPEKAKRVQTCKSRYDVAKLLKSEGPPQIQALVLADVVRLTQLATTKKRWLSLPPAHVLLPPVINPGTRKTKGVVIGGGGAWGTPDALVPVAALSKGGGGRDGGGRDGGSASQGWEAVKGEGVGGQLDNKGDQVSHPLLQKAKAVLLNLLPKHPEGLDAAEFARCLVNQAQDSAELQDAGTLTLNRLCAAFPTLVEVKVVEGKGLLFSATPPPTREGAGGVWNKPWGGNGITGQGSTSKHEEKKGEVGEEGWVEVGGGGAGGKGSGGKGEDKSVRELRVLLGEELSVRPIELSKLPGLFRAKYGRALDHKKLGFSKLKLLLETMPEVVTIVHKWNGSTGTQPLLFKPRRKRQRKGGKEVGGWMEAYPEHEGLGEGGGGGDGAEYSERDFQVETTEEVHHLEPNRLPALQSVESEGYTYKVPGGNADVAPYALGGQPGYPAETSKNGATSSAGGTGMESPEDPEDSDDEMEFFKRLLIPVS